LDSTDRLLTAGQFARLHGVPKRTLLYYDDIGLLAPAARGENGYRYYAHRQSSSLQMLLSLRELDVSIEEIRDYMKNRSPERLRDLLETKIHQAEEKIAQLTSFRALLLNNKQSMEQYDPAMEGAVLLVNCPAQLLSLSEPTRGLPDKKASEILIRHAERCHRHRLFNHNFGTMSDISSILAGDAASFDYFFTRYPDALEPPPDEAPHLRPAGHYLQIDHKGAWETLGAAYAALLRYAGENRLALTGYAYEEGLVDELAIESMDEYVTRIQVKCRTLS